MDLSYEPDDGFRRALTQLDLGEVGILVTTSADAVEWAREHGYVVKCALHKDAWIYEIRPRCDHQA